LGFATNPYLSVIVIVHAHSMKEWKIGILLWMSAALAGSLVNGIIEYKMINNLPGFQSTYIDIVIVTILLVIPAIVLSLPVVIAVKFYKSKNRFVILNFLTLTYSFGLAVIISKLTANLIEAVVIVSPYLVLTIVGMNYYIARLKKKKAQ
jgi:hypothetical protein